MVRGGGFDLAAVIWFHWGQVYRVLSPLESVSQFLIKSLAPGCGQGVAVDYKDRGLIRFCFWFESMV